MYNLKLFINDVLNYLYTTSTLIQRQKKIHCGHFTHIVHVSKNYVSLLLDSTQLPSSSSSNWDSTNCS